MIPRFAWLDEKWLGSFVSDLDTNLPRRVFHSSGDASSSGDSRRPAAMMLGQVDRAQSDRAQG
ncbi:hypothetical protein HMPREF1549_03013 [Actinomyces johnsonii F0510]|uniref:Uncharacterized protein n=1 Tax=Actinomyces johnsonii F0510 TaxID=1227262 RepID=U1PZA4_9ACTO|nr:hypothetical protein HMPREF1549_03013 [Actinomyces johnsonii F0510]